MGAWVRDSTAPTYVYVFACMRCDQYASLTLCRSALLAGLRKLPDEERQNALRVLESSRREVEAGLSALPIVVDTPSQACMHACV